MAEGWGDRADGAYRVLVDTYWSPWRGRFRACSRCRPFVQWFYWWQAHALDAVVDAAARASETSEGREGREGRESRETARAAALVAGIRRRNGATLDSRYYDDMAWLALALLRAHTVLGLRTEHLVDDLWARLLAGFDEQRGAVRWRRGDDFYNVAANAPVAILAARRGQVDLAARLLSWLHAVLVDDGQVLDGVRADGRVERNAYTYNYGTVVGAQLALHAATGDPSCLTRARTVALAAAERMRDPATGLLPPEGGGDGGLFKGILARYLGQLVAVTGDEHIRALLLRNGEAAWESRRDGLVGPDWSRAPDGPVDLSQHLSGVMLFGALARAGQ